MATSLIRHACAGLAAVVLAACSSDTTAPAATAELAAADLAARPAERCVNVQATASGTLGGWQHEGVAGGGAQPLQITLFDGMQGTMASAVSREVISGSKGQGAHHIFLSHYFWADDGVSWFRTDDRASCAPADNDMMTCQVNDHMRIVDGGGVFANAAGQIHNHGFLRFTAFGPPPAGTIDLRIIGRICGDGLSS